MPISDTLLQQYRDLAAATVYEGAGKSGDMSPEIRPVTEQCRIVARAYTVRCWPGDGSAMMRSVDEAAPGDVLVIDAGAPRACGWGGGASVAAKFRGLAGTITNGTVRDVAQIRSLGYPTFAGGICVRGAMRNQRGWTNIPVPVGEAIVHPGDLVIADIDGVVVVPAVRAEEVLEAALKRRAHEEEADRRLSAGTPYSDWTGTRQR